MVWIGIFWDGPRSLDSSSPNLKSPSWGPQVNWSPWFLSATRVSKSKGAYSLDPSHLTGGAKGGERQITDHSGEGCFLGGRFRSKVSWSEGRAVRPALFHQPAGEDPRLRYAHSSTMQWFQRNAFDCRLQESFQQCWTNNAEVNLMKALFR